MRQCAILSKITLYFMQIKTATFVRGVTDNENLIRDDLPQIAFIGRSNVGKSSLINTLTNNKSLARKSATAGRTQEINFFLINGSQYFVDLPGYGYARGSMSQRDLITERIEGYLFNADIAHHAVVLIIDANVGMTESDLSMFQELAQHNAPVVIVANKIDKLNQSDKQKNITLIKQYAGQYPVVLFSSTKKTGVEELLSHIMEA